MKKLLSDDLLSRYRSVPDFVWYIIAVLSVFFAHAYEYIYSASVYVQQLTEVLNESLSESGIEMISVGRGINATIFIVLTCVFSSVFNFLIFELINHLVSGVLLARFSAKTNRADLKFRLRICYIYSNVLIGLVGIAYFFTQTSNGTYSGVFSLDTSVENDVETILNSFLPFSSLTFFIFLFFDDARIRFLPPKKHAHALMYFARIYFGISLIFSFFDNILFISTSAPALSIASDCLAFGTVVLWTIGAFLYYLHLKKKPNEPDRNDSVVVVVDDKSHTNIYDDFGF